MRTALAPGETLLIEVRKHWVTVLGPVAAFALLTAGVVAAFAYGVPEAAIGSGVVWAVTALVLLYQWAARSRDLWAVTDLRVIDEAGVFSLNVKESPLDKIHNVSYRQTPLGRLLDYGDIEIQTAAEEGATLYTRVTSPRRLKETLSRAQEGYKEKALRLQAEKLAEALEKNRRATGALDEKTCPYCAETIKAKAIVCRFCGKALE